MTPLSPLDALGPAFRRTREVLANPFRLGFFFKVALIAALTQPSFYSASLSYPFQGIQFAALRHIGPGSGLMGFAGLQDLVGASGTAALGVAALVVAGVLMFALWIGIAYLSCRLRFTLFDLVVYKRGSIRKAWSAYGRQSWRFFGVVVLAGLAFMVLAVVLIGPTLVNVVRVIRPMIAAGPNKNPIPFLGAMLPLLLTVFAVAVLWAVVDAMMQDFLLPPMAIDDAPIEAAFRRLFSLVRANFGSVVLYILLRFAVGIGLTWILMLGLLVVLMLAGLALFGLGAFFYHALWATVTGQVICVSLAILVGIVAVLAYLAAIVSIYGVSAVFKQSYSLFFFGGRYSELGDRLEPTVLPSETIAVEPPREASPRVLPPLAGAPPVW